MKKSVFLALLCLGLKAQAQNIDLQQDSPTLKWRSISNEAVQVIYPDIFGAESIYVANLVEHYSHVVGKTYGIQKPKQFSLIIRAEASQANGFVTLGPRRSEWFASSLYFPYIGGAEWFQALSIHEYRHVNQFDYFNQRTVRGLYYIMGDMGEQLAVFLSLPSWYFEGDAVWTETRYTDSGRGRSPRFLARLKALVLSNDLPTYDQFLNGTYTTELPNQYVYGYALISYATQKYGDDVWQKVVYDVANFPQPFRLYSSFERVTGQDFASFYEETMADLKKKWAKDAPTEQAHVEYRDQINPVKAADGVYFVRQTLDTHSEVVKESQGGSAESVAKLSFSKEVSSIFIGNTKAVYAEFIPDARYGHRGSTDLIVLDLKSGGKTTVANGHRIYNPKFNATESKIIAIEFNRDQTWNIVEFDLSGNRLQSFTLPEGKVAEAAYLDDGTAALILNSKVGTKSLVTLDLKTHKISKVLIPASRNILNALYTDKKGNVFFEAQYKGSTDIFQMNQAGASRCTESKLGAYTPSSDGENLYYSDMDTYGSVIKKESLAVCKPFDTAQLIDYKYLGDSPSDNYNKFAVQAFADQEQMHTKNADKYQPEEYGDFDKRLLIPNSWGLQYDQGFNLGITSDNYLRTLSLGATVGKEAQEGQNYAGLGFAIKKYYPIFLLNLENRGRNVTNIDSLDETSWSEKNASLQMLLPYLKRKGIHTFSAVLSGTAEYTDADKYEFNEAEVAGSNYFHKTGGQLNLAWAQDLKPRSVIAPWLVSYGISYDNAEQPSDSQYSGYRTFDRAVVQTPGLFTNDGLQFTYNHQNQNDSDTAYRFLPAGAALGYAFSRGYSYKDVAEYKKLSANYVFPVAYPDWNVPNWIYVNRIYANLFFDSTETTSQVYTTPLNSYGAEFHFETKLFRIVPAVLGVRVVQRMLDDETRVEPFFGFSTGNLVLGGK
ncbi:hypothetical protein [Bdellovibrio sp. HCB288]|uniref:hypothetical protein n=1 Tax=Bdellovibrio sp. HCB288 TaxID=3394355 RepID=UPI0039B557D4